MCTYSIPTKETAKEASKAIFENLEKGLGFVPNLYADIGHSPTALHSYLAFQQAQGNGTLKAK